MIEYVIDTRTINGDSRAYAEAVKACLQDFWKNTEVKVTLVDYDVLNNVLTDYDPLGDRVRVVRTIADSVPKPPSP